MPELPLADCHVLIAEDEFYIAQDLSQAVRALGGIVIGPVASRADAMTLARSPRLHLAVLDVNLGGQMSFPIADVLDGRGIPYLFATGYDRPVIPPTYDHVRRWMKPYDSDTLAGALPAMLGPETACSH